MHTRCPACKHEHAFKCTGSASPHMKPKDGGKWLGWITSGCHSPEAEDGRLYLEFCEPLALLEEFPL